MHQPSRSSSNQHRDSVAFVENFEALNCNNNIDKENMIPTSYSNKAKVMAQVGPLGANQKTENIGNSNMINGVHGHHRTVLSDVTAQVNNKLKSIPSNSTFKSGGSSNSTSTTQSVDLLGHNVTSHSNNTNSSEGILKNDNSSTHASHDLENGHNSEGSIEDELEDQQTNEYSAIELDDNNDILMTPLKIHSDLEVNSILAEAHKMYFQQTPDLMDEDTYDVVMVAELADGIFDYMRELEIRYKPNPNYIHYQKELRWSYRRILLDWIVEVHNRFQLLPETLYLTVNIIDRFLSKKSIVLSKFQLVGAAALFIAAKYEEINCPSLKDILYMLNNANTKEEIIEAERYIIDSLEFEIGWPGPMSFLRRISKADDYDYEIRTLAKYLLESTIMDSRLISIVPSWLAASSYFLSKVILGNNSWSLKHVYYSGYTQEQIIPLATVILENCREAVHCHKAILKKYSSRRQHNSAQLVARWIGSTEEKIRENDVDNVDQQEYC